MPMKIMVVDEDEASLKLVRSLAVPLDHIVITFQDSEEAGQRAENQRFDVIFVGMAMPQPDGLGMLRRIRNSPLNAESTIVMLSGTDDIPMLRNAFREGANFFFQKPITSGRILPFLASLASPGWKTKVRAARLPLFTDVTCVRHDEELMVRSMNVSESGMLLQTTADLRHGEEVSLEFNIAEVQAQVKVKTRVARNDGRGQAGVEFIDLAPEHQNAIQLYVMGRLTPRTSEERQGTRSIWLGQGFRP